jgi:hypothetical protein
MQFTIDESGLAQIAKITDPKQVYTIMMTWYDRGTKLVAAELKARTPSRIRGKVRIKVDGFRPPRWARIDVNSPLARLIEGGTGRLGDPAFKHSQNFFPRVTGKGGIMENMGLPKPQAFLVARAISRRGGNRPKPFIRPAYEAVKGQLDQLMGVVIRDVMGGEA